MSLSPQRQVPAIRIDDVKLRWFAFLVVLLAGCSSKQDYKNPPWNAEVPVKRAMQWMPISEKAGAAWGVSPQLITAIIAIESGGNPNAVSKSNAIGLMQLKASTSGRDVYRRMGWIRCKFRSTAGPTLRKRKLRRGVVIVSFLLSITLRSLMEISWAST
jgi:membrane-bound lytic murein transglycosylase E